MGFSRQEYWSGSPFPSPVDHILSDLSTMTHLACLSHRAWLSFSIYIMRNTGLEKAQAGIKIAGRNINNLKYADDTTLVSESEEELKSLLMKVKEESEKVGLKLSTQKSKVMASGPITSWQIDGEKVETVADFVFLSSKITADGDFSHEIKRHFLLGRQVMTKLDSILKSRNITLSQRSVWSRLWFFQW